MQETSSQSLINFLERKTPVKCYTTLKDGLTCALHQEQRPSFGKESCHSMAVDCRVRTHIQHRAQCVAVFLSTQLVTHGMTRSLKHGFPQTDTHPGSVESACSSLELSPALYFPTCGTPHFCMVLKWMLIIIQFKTIIDGTNFLWTSLICRVRVVGQSFSLRKVF